VKSTNKKSASPHLATATRATARSLGKPVPFLKWAGGKSQLLSSFEPFLPKRFNRYLEPFVGGGAMFFNIYGRNDRLSASLSDLNSELINCYSAVRDNVEELIDVLKQHRNEREYFYEIRSLDTQKLSSLERAARLIYLNKTCFNGLYRVNSRGQFNVPFGSYKNPRTCDEENLRAASTALQQVVLTAQSFSDAMEQAKRGDFVYLDPPYQPLSATANFTSYTSRCFMEKDQQELAAAVRKLDKRGCRVMLSNSDNEFVRDLYDGLRIETVYATRAINCRGDRRGKISEVLVLNY
jgi:DNA adenine methylase